MSSQLRQLQHGTLIEEQYLLERQLGAGGMGTVWIARDMRLARSVAIKFLGGDFYHDEPARQRFEREARMASKIRSPHVVQVFAAGITADGVPYVVMELLEGEDLAARLQRNGACSLVEAGVIVEQVCRALTRSHREGLVHRDIKPHNIFLIPEAGGQLFVKLLDFGIAKDTGAKATTLTVTGAVVGSVFYISPEQLRDAPSVDQQADLWALGVVIYQMLTGTVPFDGDSLPELLLRITECRYVPPTRVNPSLPPEIDAFLSRAITPDRTQRYATADELANAFARIVRAHSSGFVRKPELSSPSQPPAAERAPVAPPLPARSSTLAGMSRPAGLSGSASAGTWAAWSTWAWAAGFLALAAGTYLLLRSDASGDIAPARAEGEPSPSAVSPASDARERDTQETTVNGALNADAPPASEKPMAAEPHPSVVPPAVQRSPAPVVRSKNVVAPPVVHSPQVPPPAAPAVAPKPRTHNYGF